MRGLVIVLVLAVAPAAAAAEPLPSGRIALAVGIKSGTGALAGSIGRGYAVGFEAGYAPMTRTQRVGWGASWSTTWSYYWSGSARVADEMKILEMDAGLRLRVALGARKRQVLFLGGGGALLRTNEPVFADGDRTKVGPWGGAGVEGRDPIFGAVVIAVSVRYGLIRDGQGTLGVMLSVGSGR